MAIVCPGYEIPVANITVPSNGKGVIQDFKLKSLADSEPLQAGQSPASITQLRIIQRYDGGSSGGSMYIVGVHLMMIGALAAMFVCQGTGLMQQKQRQ
jgi:hypothetical protein